MDLLTRNQTRDYFKACGLSYNDITLRDLKYLKIELDDKFNDRSREVMNGNGYEYWVRVNEAKYFKGKYADDGHMICAYLTAKGAYFYAREAVSLNTDGFIGFAGDACDNNVQPVLEAFIIWCDWMKGKKATLA